MDYGWKIEQLFPRRDGGRYAVLAVLESPTGERRRETIPTPGITIDGAVTYVARHFARRSDVDGTRRLRVREDRAGNLVERPDLTRAFREAFETERTDTDR